MCFVDKCFPYQHALLLSQQQEERIIEVIDGYLVSSGNIMQLTHVSQMLIMKRKIFRCLLLNLGTAYLILVYPGSITIMFPPPLDETWLLLTPLSAVLPAIILSMA
jgi:hypothetical protein